ncbi:MAG: 2,3-dihydroxybiphenyl 1,2-dioxygenase, partial [Acidimicrobiales bacterium]
MGMDCVGIAYYGYESPNYKEWLDYGPEVYGFGLNETRGDEGVYLTMDDQSEYRLAIHPGEVNRMAYVGLHMKNKFAWEDGIETLRRYGIEVTVGDEELEAKRGCSGVAQFKDPDGWPHELAYGLKYDRARWRPGRAHAGFESPTYGLGHTVLISNDLAKIDDYALNCMEYKWFIHGLKKGMASFYRTKLSNLSHVVAYGCNPNHQYGDTTTALPHIGIYCNTLDDVGIAYDLV